MFKYYQLESVVEVELQEARIQFPVKKKIRIRETSNLLTDADSRTDTNFESLRDLSRKKKKKKMGRLTRPRIHAMGPRVGNGGSAPTPRF